MPFCADLPWGQTEEHCMAFLVGVRQPGERYRFMSTREAKMHDIRLALLRSSNSTIFMSFLTQIGNDQWGLPGQRQASQVSLECTIQRKAALIVGVLTHIQRQWSRPVQEVNLGAAVGEGGVIHLSTPMVVVTAGMGFLCMMIPFGGQGGVKCPLGGLWHVPWKDLSVACLSALLWLRFRRPWESTSHALGQLND